MAVELLGTTEEGQEVVLVLDDGGPNGSVRVVSGNHRTAATILESPVPDRKNHRWLTSADGVRMAARVAHDVYRVVLRARIVPASAT